MSVLAGISDIGSKIFGILTSGVQRGLTGNAILETLQEQGLGYRRTTFLSDIRVIRGAEREWSALRYVTREAVPSLSHYQYTRFPMERRYQTIVELRGINRETGLHEVRNVAVSHDSLITRAELEEDARSVVEEVSPQFEIEEMLPVSARQSPIF